MPRQSLAEDHFFKGRYCPYLCSNSVALCPPCSTPSQRHTALFATNESQNHHNFDRTEVSTNQPCTKMNWLRLFCFTHLVATDDPLHFRRMRSISSLALVAALIVYVVMWRTAPLDSFQCDPFQGIYHWPFSWNDLLELCQDGATWSDRSWLNVNSTRVRLCHSARIGQYIFAVNDVPFTLLTMVIRISAIFKKLRFLVSTN